MFLPNSFNEFCSPLPWTLISPKALLVNKKSEIFNTEKTHYELIKHIHNTWTDWTDQYPAIFVTFNGMRFDEEVMRRQFYWNLYDPYFTNTNGNTRLDLFLKIQMVKQLKLHLIQNLKDTKMIGKELVKEIRDGKQQIRKNQENLRSLFILNILLS